MTQRQEEQRQEQLKVAEAQSRQLQLEALLQQNQIEVQKLQSQQECLQQEVKESSRRCANTESEDIDQELRGSCCKDPPVPGALFEIKDQRFTQDPLQPFARHLAALEAEVQVAEENVAVETAACEASTRRLGADPGFEVIEALRSEERHGAAQHRQRCLEQEAAHAQQWQERMRFVESAAKDSASSIQQKYFKVLRQVQEQNEKDCLNETVLPNPFPKLLVDWRGHDLCQESSDFRRTANALRLELSAAQALCGAHGATPSEPVAQVAAELRERFAFEELLRSEQAELNLFAHVQELKEEVESLQTKEHTQAEDEVLNRQLEEREGLEIQALREELYDFKSEAGLFGCGNM
eukprot:g28061.t1